MTDFDPWILAPDDEFETALKRKRKDNRPFYLCLRARARLEQGLAGEAREILQRALELAHPNPRDYYRQAIETELARLDIAEGDDRNAEEIFRRILSADSSYGGLDGLAGVELAELLVKRGALGEAADWLTKWYQENGEDVFDIHLFHYAACWARLSIARDDAAEAATWASRALEVAGRPDEFARHPGVGSARPSGELRAWLESLAVRDRNE